MSKTEKRNVPALRFPEFQDEWVERRLEDLFIEFKSGKNIKASKINDSGNYPVYGGNGLRGYTDIFSHDGEYFLIGRQGALCGNINRFSGKAFVSEHAIACRSNDFSDTEWLAQRLDYFNLNRLSESSAQPGLSVQKLLRFKLVVPTRSEATKIATFLTSVDKKIAQVQEKKRLSQEFKKGMMQKLFSQQIRFKDDQGNDFPEWEEKRLGDILIEYKERVDANTNLPILTSSRNGLYPQKDYFANRELQNEGEYGVVPKGFFTYRHMSDDATFKFNINEYCERGAISKEYPVFTTKDYSARFLYEILNNGSDFKRFALTQKQGGTRTRLYFKNLCKMVLSLPISQEATKIATYLTALDDKIQNLENQIRQAKAFKQGLLQQMLV
ncbi:restriction endonuclease subunit S (plasmid) [Fulvitalea axinellae]|uniref:Restriction endonuclease subunit S n=1 Tax=Fulvitalea axinellae TaxID=1182444 RepID=A0AAU9CZ51_9BACT|nr:restriction endonuclease subunit S [Fulvitalea axinellae]